MPSIDQNDWAWRLRPLDLAVADLDGQLVRRRNLVLVGSGLLGGLILFVLILFASFGRADLGLAVGLILFGAPLGWNWWDYRRLRELVARYQCDKLRASESNGTPV